GPGPVFAFESLIAARRWQVYALRATYVGVLLAGLALTWGPADRARYSPAEAAAVGRLLLDTVIAVQLAAVLLAAPAATAGAVCVDKARGTLIHAFVTDLSDREIVLGKLGARLAPVLGLLACGLPVLALGSFLGGIDLVAVIGAELVTAGVAVLCCTVALIASVWARKPHQALLLAYLVVGLWVVLVPASLLLFPIGPPTSGMGQAWVLSNPIVAAFVAELSWPIWRPGLREQAAFFLVTLLVSWLPIALASRRLRPTVLAQANRPQKRERPDAPARLLDYLPGPPLDGNPVLWREWHRKRPSRWTGRFWTAYAIVSALASLYVIGFYYFWWGHGLIYSGIQVVAAQVNAWQVSVGLLLLSVSAATALAEERDRGSLDVIMTTPLTTREIVWGKWWGTFAMVPRLAILPIWVSAGAAMITGGAIGLVLMIGQILAYAAVITSLGLALATWIPRLGRVITVSVMAYVLVALGWPLVLQVLSILPAFRMTAIQMGSNWDGLNLASPFFGIYATTEWAARWWYGTESSFWSGFRPTVIYNDPTWPLIWIGVDLAIALILAFATLRTFDRCLGRVPETRPV
ncbi:MAG TPA: ABC transporter permease, partial [Isosphaeraceae bacterium]|nr:ABC transporter permease [Isosphaeraceae bacterium]